jgi:hypothetical protein
MALIQAIITFIGRTVGKILSALLDWAVVALFGRVSGQRKILLWALMAAAATWPLLLLGVVAPRAAVFLVAFVPMSASLAPGLVRTIWIALAVLVPLAVGVTLRLLSPTGRREGWLLSIVRGVPITAGLSASFAVLLVTVPVLRVVSAARGRQDTYVPLVTTPDSYQLAAEIVPETLRRHRIAIARVEPPWWSALPSRILKRLGQGAFAGYVAEQTAYFRNGDLEAALYPNALLLRGPARVTGHAQVLAVEALTGYPDMFQTVSPAAQELERQIQRVWEVVRSNPEAHAYAGPLLSRLDEIKRDMANESLPFEDLQVIYRQLLQLGRALAGESQLLERTRPTDAKERVMTVPTPHSALDHEARSLTTRELVARALQTGSLLVSKEVELARAEIKADIAAELGMVKLLLAGAAVGLFGVNLLFVAAVFALTAWMPGWLASLGVAVLLLAIGAVLGLIGWRRRVSSPLAVTRKTVKEDMQWAKERLA